MKDDYLWDKSGQPDPEIQKLEEILGTLRYQPRPLDLPAPRRRGYFPLLAIAASVMLALLAAGLWFRALNQSAPRPDEANVISTPLPVDEKEPKQITPKAVEKYVAPSPDKVATNNKPRRKPMTPALSKREREEALMAKEQLMIALRLTTEKLSLVQRKTQNTTPANQIKNQHRVG